MAVLGPLQVEVDGREVDVPGLRRRAVLAMLAMSGGRVIGVDALLDVLWPDHPPETGRRAVHSLVSRLRGNLGPASGGLRLVGHGYALDVDPDGLDASVARRLAREVNACLATDPGHAVDLVRQALALWRGPALAEFRDVAPLAAAAVGLTELHHRLRDDAVQAALATGQQSVTSLAAEVAASTRPPRERSVLLLMQALAAEGRAADAMATAAVYRRQLADDTGLDPGPAFAAFEQRIAAGEPRNELTAGSAANPTAPAVNDRATGPGSAPIRATGPMTGRDQDRTDLLRLLDSYPVVTVTGPGGVGKTRLTMDVAAEVADRRQSRVAVVALAAVMDSNRVPHAVVSSLGLRVTGDIGVWSVADALADQSILLVLDNCEHVVAACRELVTALQSRGVRVLATSRVRLHVPGEYVLRLQPLPLPDDATDLPGLLGTPSVQALVQHARRMRPDFELTTADTGPVTEIVRRLDGLPLAIELAAAQLAAVSVRAVRDRLGRALDALTTERPAADARHRTLRATIDWSYRLLAPPDRHLLSAVAAFPGGVDLTTMEQLGNELLPGIDPLTAITRLVDASLLVVDQPTMTRYTLLHTVRQFLFNELDTDQQDTAIRRFLASERRTALEIGTALHSAQEPDADQRLRAELANLRAARDLATTRGDVELLIDLTLALDEASIWRGMPEVWAWSLELADDPALPGHPRETEVLGSAAIAAWLLGDLDRAVALASRGLALNAAAGITRNSPNLASEDPERRCWRALGAISLFRSDFPAAREQLLRAAAGPHPEQPATIAAAALAALYAGDRAGANHLLGQVSDLLRHHSWPSVTAFVSYIQGEVLATNDPDAAIAAYTEAGQTARRCGAGFIEGAAMVGRATLSTASGDTTTAANSYRCLLDYWQSTGNRTMLWTTARNTAQLLLDQDRNHTAAIVLAAADAAHSANTPDTPIAEGLQRLTTILTQRLGATSLETLRQEAQSLGEEEVLDLMRNDLDKLKDTLLPAQNTPTFPLLPQG
ncbi:BTAD domain-containing putative transcriptional regulator [Nakamurella sp. GG22]